MSDFDSSNLALKIPAKSNPSNGNGSVQTTMLSFSYTLDLLPFLYIKTVLKHLMLSMIWNALMVIERLVVLKWLIFLEFTNRYSMVHNFSGIAYRCTH